MNETDTGKSGNMAIRKRENTSGNDDLKRGETEAQRESREKRHKQAKGKKGREWTSTALEILKWAFVLWLLWPLRQPTETMIDFVRVVLGVLLFIIFAGKLLYDTVIMSIIRQRRNTGKQDLITMIGMVLVMGLVVGLLFLFTGYVFIELYRNMQRPEE
jgi:hypothetical protein